MELEQLLDDAAPAGLADPEADGSPVLLALAAEVLEARVALSGPGRGRRIDLLEVGDHLLDRGVEAVEIEAVEPGGIGGIAAVVVRAQPADEVEHLGVAPHPGREALKAAQRLLGVRVLAGPADVAVDAVGVGPVGLDGDAGETLLLDQPAGDQGALAVELVGAVRGLAEQDEAGVADLLQQRVVVVRRAAEGMHLPRSTSSVASRWPVAVAPTSSSTLGPGPAAPGSARRLSRPAAEITASLRLPQALQLLGARPAVKCFDLHWRQMFNIDPPSSWLSLARPASADPTRLSRMPTAARREGLRFEGPAVLRRAKLPSLPSMGEANP